MIELKTFMFISGLLKGDYCLTAVSEMGELLFKIRWKLYFEKISVFSY